MSGVKVTLRYATIGAEAGDVIEVDKDIADRLVENGLATPVRPAPKPEKD